MRTRRNPEHRTANSTADVDVIVDVNANRRFPSWWWRSEQIGRCDDEIAVIADRRLGDRAA